MEQNQCFSCILCDFMTYSPVNLEQHFKVRHDGTPPKYVFKQVSEPLCAIIRQADLLLHKTRRFSTQVPLEHRAGVEGSAVTLRNTSGGQVEMIHSSSKAVPDLTTDLSHMESKPYPMKSFTSPVNESHSPMPRIKQYPDKIKEESLDLSLVPFHDDNRQVLGHHYQEVDVTGQPLLMTVDILFSAESRIDERTNNSQEKTSEYSAAGTKNEQSHWYAQTSNRPGMSQCVWNSEAHRERDNFVQIQSSTISVPWICTKNHLKDTPSGTGLCREKLPTSTFPRTEKDHVKIEVFDDPQNEELISAKVHDPTPQPAASLEMSHFLQTSEESKKLIVPMMSTDPHATQNFTEIKHEATFQEVTFQAGDKENVLLHENSIGEEEMERLTAAEAAGKASHPHLTCFRFGASSV